MTTLKQVPLTCGGHTRPVVHLDFSDVTKDGYYLISACKGKFWLLLMTNSWLGVPFHLGLVVGGRLSSVFMFFCADFHWQMLRDHGGLHFSRYVLSCPLDRRAFCAYNVVTFSFRTCRKHLEYPLVCFLGAGSPWVSYRAFNHVVVAWYATSTPLCSWNYYCKWKTVFLLLVDISLLVDHLVLDQGLVGPT